MATRGRSLKCVTQLRSRSKKRPDAANHHALVESEQLHRQLFEMVSDWFWETDSAGRLTDVSPKIEAIFGVPASADIGKSAPGRGTRFDILLPVEPAQAGAAA